MGYSMLLFLHSDETRALGSRIYSCYRHCKFCF